MLEEKEWVYAEQEHLSKRLDQALCQFFPEYSRTYFQHLIEEGCVRINGSFPKKREKLSLGDEIEILFKKPEALSLIPENIPLNILFEDEHFIAINKPRGLVVHPAPGHASGTVVNALLYHCTLDKEMDAIRPGIVHRLDKDTSGVLLIAKTLSSHAKLSSLFAKRLIAKTYVAICCGNPGNCLIDAPLARHPIRRKEIAVVADGKKAITSCRTLATKGDLSCVELDLITGRTHQIRVHLKSKNAPVLGDMTYGSASVNHKYGITTQQLHAYRVSFVHPFTNKTLSIAAPLPKDIQSFLQKVEFNDPKYLLD